MDDIHITGISQGGAASADERLFGPRRDRSDRMIDWAIRSAIVAIIAVAAYLGWAYYSNTHLAETQSPAARAVSNLTNVVLKSPNNAMARLRLAEALIANDKQDEAITQLAAALKIEKDNAQALTDLGLIAMDRGEWKTAEGYWTRIIGIIGSAEMASKDQRLADTYYYLGTSLVEQKRYEEAVANLKRSLQIKRDSSPVHYMLSVAYQRLGLADKQKEELQIVLAFDPTEAQANYDLGMLTLKTDVASAAEFFRIAADRAPAGIELPKKQLAALGGAAEHLATAGNVKTSDPRRALSEARIAAAIDPTNVDAVRLVATLSEGQKDLKRAVNAWQRVLELVPGDAPATDAIKRLSAHVK
jgi:tetratricopeptide (TPR) repeat protein